MADESDRAPEWSPPQEFDEYRLVRALGRGSMGRVFLAQDRLLDRPVAVKFIAGREPDDDTRARFFVEARAIARLQHPHVVAIHRVGEIGRRPYLVSEFVRGESLDRIAKPIPWRRALEIGIGLARGLGAAHRRGVLHRDIKPANAILTEEGEVKLLDFGLATFMGAAGVDVPVTRPSGAPAPADRAVASTLSLLGAGSAAPGDSPPAAPRSAGERGPVVGTPLYMAPEIWRGEPATRASDIYSLGVVLYELATGHAPHHGLTLDALGQAVREGAPVPLGDVLSGVDRHFAAVVDRCLAPLPEMRFPSGDALREALEAIGAEARTGPFPEGNPYRGLRPFEAEHRALFFGRDADIRAVLERLRSDPFVLVAGGSGVGKSSLCRAGILPAWAEHAPGAIARFVPGRRPLAALSAALAPWLGEEEEALAARLAAEPGALVRALRQRQGPERLLFVDQMEELFTIADGAEAALVAEALGALVAQRTTLRLLGTVRGDRVGGLAQLPVLGDDVTRALYWLRPLSAEGIRASIVGPARSRGFRFEPESLIEEVVASSVRAEGGLPLLQFALAELWEARDEERHLIPAAALDALGGVAGALARHADQVLAELGPKERLAARRILGKLITPEGTEGTRLRRSRSELLPAARDDGEGAALDVLVRGRLLVVHAAEDADGTYEIAHEALLQGWDTLQGWLANDLEVRAARHRLERAAADWERLGRPREALWIGAQLDEVGSLAPHDLEAREAAFLAASRRAVRARRRRRVATVSAVLLAAGLLFGGLRLHAQRALDRSVAFRVDEAKRALLQAQQQFAVAEQHRLAAFARFDARDREGGERLWEQALAAARGIERLQSGAGRELEAAYLLDSSRKDVRALLAEVLYERALTAERSHRPAELDDLLQRLANFDEDGRQRRKWSAPARLTALTSPRGATVSLQQYETVDGYRRLTTAKILGTTPLSALELAPASYLLTLSSPGRISIRYPVLLERGEAHRVEVALPASVPRGFVYVPRGRFLFGSGDDESVRRILNALPLRRVETGPYLVARTEVTFGEWLDFLRSLPPAERARRRPHAGTAHLTGSIDLRELPTGDFGLTMRPTTETYTTRIGESIHYRERRQRATLDWRAAPVSGISLDDAQAYVAWLARSGRVPSARLCDEHEWERAARGADDRAYPHGDRLAPDDANHDVTYGRKPLAFGPDAVGSHPGSDSPFGIADLAGNVWEWTRSVVSTEEVVIRGGSWYQEAFDSRSNNRAAAEPSQRLLIIGLRVCAEPS